MKKTVVLGVTSGIAAYKSIDLVKLLKKEGVAVNVIMTKAAAKMVSPQEFEKASGNKVFTELFEKDFDYKNILQIRKVDHIDLADSADAIVIAPATANIIAKLAQGFADDFLTTTVLAATSPIILCPSMNVHMWGNPIVQENLEQLRKSDFIIVPPEKGPLACGYDGQGRLAHLEKIKDETLRQLSYVKSLVGKKIIVTAGGTIEKIDAVRSISNKSSGKMGIALAEECYMRGADVLLLRSKTSVSSRYLIREEIFETSTDLEHLIKQNIAKFDVIFHAAAVSDFSVKEEKGKIPSGKKTTLSLIPQKKIISIIKKWNPKISLFAFKAEATSDEKKLVNAAREVLRESDPDAVIANDISRKDRGFQADTNEVYIATKENVQKISLRPKQDIAREIIDLLLISLPKNVEPLKR